MKNPYADPNSYSSQFRRKRFEHVQKLIEDILAKKGSCRIADIGGEEDYWQYGTDLIANNDVEIHLFNLFEKPTTNPKMKSLKGDATDLSDLDDMSYDLVHSNSVIEHVGNWRNIEKMAANCRRLAPKYYVQTPYFWFPYEPHFRAVGFQWLPEQFRMRLVMNMKLGFFQQQSDVASAMDVVQSCYLLDDRQFKSCFPDAQFKYERAFGLTKSLIAIRE